MWQHFRQNTWKSSVPLTYSTFLWKIRSRLGHLTTLVLTLRQNLKLHRPRPGPPLIRRRFRRRWRYPDRPSTVREPKISEPLRTWRPLIIRILRNPLLPLLASAFALFLGGVRGDIAPHARGRHSLAAGSVESVAADFDGCRSCDLHALSPPDTETSGGGADLGTEVFPECHELILAGFGRQRFLLLCVFGHLRVVLSLRSISGAVAGDMCPAHGFSYQSLAGQRVEQAVDPSAAC